MTAPATKMTAEQVKKDLQRRRVTPEPYVGKRWVAHHKRHNRDLTHTDTPVSISGRSARDVLASIRAIGEGIAQFRPSAKHRAATKNEKSRRRAHARRLQTVSMRSLTIAQREHPEWFV